jgi:His-Xaa-Ser system radical SAM maturase HxsB
MTKFEPAQAYGLAAREKLVLLPLRFERLDSCRLVITNFVGELFLLEERDFRRIVDLELSPGDGLYERAFEKALICRSGQEATMQLLAMRLRSRMSFLNSVTSLHIFVVTLRCEHSCPYCQVSRRSTEVSAFDMDIEIASKALDIALSAPPPIIKIEFQGGEPLLNFSLIKTIVEAAERLAPLRGKKTEFVIATNLALLSDDILSYCSKHLILLSTSLDGPADLHNRNRPRPGGNSHALAVSGIRRAQEVLGPSRVSALMTTTEASLSRAEDIIDEYISLNLPGIFLRPLSPYGFAVKTRWFNQYDSSRWLEFYERGLRYLLKINRSGKHFPEFYSSLLLKRMLTDQPLGYVDLRSPAGIGIGALVYNYDGKVFASDEGRMLAEMGDDTFELGHVSNADYVGLVTSEHLVSLVGGSLSQSSPQCTSCAFEQHCGADPVYHHATQGDITGIKPLSGFCSRQKAVLKLLIRILEQGGGDADVLRSWATT